MFLTKGRAERRQVIDPKLFITNRRCGRLLVVDQKLFLAVFKLSDRAVAIRKPLAVQGKTIFAKPLILNIK